MLKRQLVNLTFLFFVIFSLSLTGCTGFGDVDDDDDGTTINFSLVPTGDYSGNNIPDDDIGVKLLFSIDSVGRITDGSIEYFVTTKAVEGEDSTQKSVTQSFSGTFDGTEGALEFGLAGDNITILFSFESDGSFKAKTTTFINASTDFDEQFVMTSFEGGKTTSEKTNN